MDALEDYKRKVMRIAKYTLLLELVFVIGLFTSYASIFLGLMLGTAVSLINTFFTAWKINRIGEIAANTNEHNRTKYASAGMLTRMALTVLTVLFVLQYPHFFNLYSTLIGLFITQIISVVDSIKTK